MVSFFVVCFVVVLVDGENGGVRPAGVQLRSGVERLTQHKLRLRQIVHDIIPLPRTSRFTTLISIQKRNLKNLFSFRDGESNFNWKI